MYGSEFRRIFTRSAAAAAAALAVITQLALPAPAAGHVAMHAAAPQHSSVNLRQRAALAAGTIPLVYVSESTGSVLAYAANSVNTTQLTTPVETIANLNGPAGLAVDAAGNLYVVERGTNDVKVFSPGSLTPFKTLAGITGQRLSTIAIGGDGTLYAGTLGNVVEVYRNGATTPSATLSSPFIVAIVSIAADRVGNVFITYFATGGGYAVGTFPAAVSLGAGFFAPLPALIGPFIPWDIGIDSGGDLLVGDMNVGNYGGSGGIEVYHPATKSPAFKFGYLDRGGFELFALGGPSGGTIFITPAQSGFIVEQAFPSGFVLATFDLPAPSALPSSPQVWGIAAYPAAPLGTW